MTTPRRRIALAITLCAVAACGGPGSSGAAPTAPFPTLPPNNGQDQLGGSNPACQQASAPIAGIAQVEAGLRSGGTTDAAAEENVLGIQQFLVQVQQQVGQTSPIGQALQNVVYQLGELGTLLNQNATIDRINPVLANVDAAVRALASACASS